MMVYYIDEIGRKIEFDVHNTEALYAIAEGLLKAPIDLQYLESDVGLFNLSTFEWC